MPIGAINLDPVLRDEDLSMPGPPPDEEGTTSGQWPRMLNLDDDTERRLKMFLEHEIHLAWSERDTISEDWDQWQRDYWAKPTQSVKNFPFRKAANIVIPMTAIAVEAIFARMMNTLFSVRPFWSIRPRSREWVEAAPITERWLQMKADDPDDLDAYGFCQDTLLELIKLGTAVGKSGYEKDIAKTIQPDVDGSEREVYVTRHNGSTLNYVPVANFLIRFHETSPQTAEWVGEEHRFNWSQLKRYALSGRMIPEAVEMVGESRATGEGSMSTAKKYDDDRRELEDMEPAWHEDFYVQEIWCSFDVDQDGVDEEIVVDYSYETDQILSIRYNWYADLHRPYRVAQYMAVEGRVYGMGVGKQNEQFQQLITTLHRQRLDAGTLANMGQLAVKKSSGYGPGEPIFPGKMWFLDDVSDIEPFSLSDNHHSGHINNEEFARQYSDKRTGVNETILGVPQQGTPATATSDLAKLAESNKKFDASLKNIRRWLAQLGRDVLSNEQQFGPERRAFTILGEEEDQIIEQVLSLPSQLVRDGAIIDLTVTDSITNRDVEQQKWTSLFAVLTQHHDKVLEKAAMTQNQQLFMLMASVALQSSNNLMTRLLETYQVPNPEDYLLELTPEMIQNAGLTPIAEVNEGGPPGALSEAGSSRIVQALGNGGTTGNQGGIGGE